MLEVFLNINFPENVDDITIIELFKAVSLQNK